jgi:hypothetical protein
MTESSVARSVDSAVGAPVEMVLPAVPALSRLARLAAGGLASLTGFTIDEIENIKLAVSEVMVALVEHGSGSPVLLDFRVDDNAFVVRGRTAMDEFDPSDPDFELSGMVLGEVCSEHGMQFAAGYAEISATVTRAG